MDFFRKFPPALRRLAWPCLLALLATIPSHASDATALEYKVKAGYLFNFGKFVEWPVAAFASERAPFVIGVLDGGEATPVIQSLLAGRAIDGRPVQVVPVDPAKLGPGLHILLVTRTAGKTAEAVRALLGSAPTLVVGETEHFAERGGTIGFTLEDDSVRVHLNLERATESGLKVSAKLASVAKLVKPRRGS